jgi:hypothetical protein
MLKTTILHLLLGSLGALASLLPAAAQCPTVTSLLPYGVTSTTASIGANYNTGPAGSTYTLAATPTAGGPTQTLTTSGSANQLTGLLPATAYTVRVVTNCPNGSASAPATASFTTLPLAPANDEPAAAGVLPVTTACAQPVAGTIVSATESLPGQVACGALAIDRLADVWYRFVATGPTQVLSVTSAFAGYAELRAGQGAPGPAMDCVRFLGPFAPAPSVQVLRGLTSGQTYYLRIIALVNPTRPAAESSFSLCLQPGPLPPANDECSAATWLGVNPTPYVTYGTTEGATYSPVPDEQPVLNGILDVWYRFVVSNPTQTINLDAVDLTQTFGVEVRGGACGSVFNTRGLTSPSAPGYPYAPVHYTLYNCTPGDVYYLRVYGFDSYGGPYLPRLGDKARFLVSVTGLLPCPAPTAQPTTVGSTTAQLSWSGAPGSSYTLEYGPQGFAPGTGTIAFTGLPTYALSGLLPDTDYCYYLRADCGFAGPTYAGTTIRSGPHCFQTTAPAADCTPPTNLAIAGQGPGYVQVDWQAQQVAGTTFEVEYGPAGFALGTGTRQPHGTLYGLLPGTEYCVYVRRSCGSFVGPLCFRAPGPAVLPDLVVSTPQTLAGGAYRNVTITGTGALSLSGDLAVAGVLTVEAGGTLRTTYRDARNNLACATIIGAGRIELQDGATLGICAGLGVAASGSSGAVQLTGGRSFSPGASYEYEGLPALQAQSTGSGLPPEVRNLRVGRADSYVSLLLSQPVAVREVLAFANGNLDTNGQALTLLSDARGTALVDNTSGRVTGNVTVQRFINGPYQGVGYRHYSAPVTTATVGSLATAGFGPVVNAAYNTAAVPGDVTPFPTVYGYDEARLATSPATGGTAFDKGWVSPASLGDPLVSGRGYTVHLPGAARLSVTGPLNQSGAGSQLSRGPAPEAGWHLLGNPFPSPLDAATLTTGTGPGDNLQGVGAAIYVYESSGPYVGTYRTAVAGVGGSPVIASGQGFFVRALPGFNGPNGVLFQVDNRNRVTSFRAADNTFRRGAADTRPLLTLALRDAAGHADPASIYFTAAATARFDPAADALKLPNTTGLNLASQLSGEDYAINGLPLLGAQPLVLPLAVGVPAAGAYELAVDQLLNFAPGTTLYLRDALLGTLTPLTAATRYPFTVAGFTAPGRFSVEFRPAGALATAAQVLEAQAQVFPNPATAGMGVTVVLPARPGTRATATLLNALGQPVGGCELVERAGQATGQLPTAGLAAGVYVVRIQTRGGCIARRLVLQ